MATWKAPESIEEVLGGVQGKDWADAPKFGKKSDADLPRGLKPIQLYSMGTPNGKKISIMLEELGVEYDAHMIDITKGDQFKSGFVDLNPNSKIPCIVDLFPNDNEKHPHGEGDNAHPLTVFESASILIYLAEKYSSPLLPSDPKERTECMNWLMWSATGISPMCGNFGHFFVYAPKSNIEAIDYGVARYGGEVLRLLSVLDHQLAKHPDGYMCGNEITIADIATYPWMTTLDEFYHSLSFLGLTKEQGRFPHLQAWIERMSHRPAVQRGMKVLTREKSASSSSTAVPHQPISITSAATKVLVLIHAVIAAVIGVGLLFFASKLLACKGDKCNPIANEADEILLFRSVTGAGYLTVAFQGFLHVLLTLNKVIDPATAFSDYKPALAVAFAFNLLTAMVYSRQSLKLSINPPGNLVSGGDVITIFHVVFTFVFAVLLMITKQGSKQVALFKVNKFLKSQIVTLSLLVNAIGEINTGIAFLVGGNFLLPNLRAALASDGHSMGAIFKLTSSIGMIVAGLITFAYLINAEDKSLKIVLPTATVYHILATYGTLVARKVAFPVGDLTGGVVFHAVMVVAFAYFSFLAFNPPKGKKWSAQQDGNKKNN